MVFTGLQRFLGDTTRRAEAAEARGEWEKGRGDTLLRAKEAKDRHARRREHRRNPTIQLLNFFDKDAREKKHEIKSSVEFARN